MKKLSVIFTIAFFCLSFGTMKAQQGNENSLEGRARGAAHECLQDYHTNYYDITSTITVDAICIVSGFLYTVTFYATPNCHGASPCPHVGNFPVASVSFGCDGEITGVTCY